MRYVDIALLAIDMFKKYPYLKIEEGGVQNVYSENNSILSATSDYIGLSKIDVYTTDTLEQLPAMMLRYLDGKREFRKIYVSNELNNCWTRFIVAKEICHNIVDIRSLDFINNVQDFENLIEEVNNQNFLSTTSIDDDIFSSEKRALYMAFELLVPYKFNDILLTDRRSFDIAKEYLVPEKVIDHMRSKKYQQMRLESYKDL